MADSQPRAIRLAYAHGRAEGRRAVRAGEPYQPRCDGPEDARQAYGLGYMDGWIEANPCEDGACGHAAHGTYVHPADPRRDHDISLALYHIEAAAEMHGAGLTHDTDACGYPHRTEKGP